MPPQPIYRPDNIHPAYQLRYAWTAWPSRGTTPPPLPALAWHDLSAAWEVDGLRVLEHVWHDDRIQIVFSAKPEVTPVFLAARAKGRLDHAYRVAGQPCDFSRKVAVRSIGDVTRATVERYVSEQVRNGAISDPRYREALERLRYDDPAIDLAVPTETRSGRYWYNLHLVLVTADRASVTDEAALTLLRDRSVAIAAKKEYGISRLAMMPDHLHIALRGNLDHSPQEIALAFQNNLAYALGQRAVWEHTYYVGTFGEYDMEAVRKRQAGES